MLHPDGYSVSVHTQDNVGEVKNCYLLSDEISPNDVTTLTPRAFEGDPGRLYWQSTLLNGFDAAEPEKPGVASDIANARAASARSDWEHALRLWRGPGVSGAPRLEIDTNIGLCLLKIGEIRNAKAVMRGVLNACPDDGFARSILAYTHEAERDYTHAAGVWRDVTTMGGLPDWLKTNAAEGLLRCEAAAKSRG